MTKTTVKMNDVVDHLKRAIEGVRPRGIPILFGPMRTRRRITLMSSYNVGAGSTA
jgi:hypothetical protein